MTTTIWDPNIGDVKTPSLTGVAASGANTDITSLTPTTITTSGASTAGSFVTSGACTAGSFVTTGLSTFGSAKLDAGTKTGTASSGAVTLSKSSGKITSEALTTAGLAAYTLTVTSTVIAAADQVYVSLANGSNTHGTPSVGLVTPAAGSVVIIINNDHATEALNGTLVISFMVLKA